MGKKVEYYIFAIKGLNENFILGIDFIRENNLNYCPRCLIRRVLEGTR